MFRSNFEKTILNKIFLKRYLYIYEISYDDIILDAAPLHEITFSFKITYCIIILWNRLILNDVFNLKKFVLTLSLVS